MKNQLENRKLLNGFLLILPLSLSACADWQSSPKHLDENFGNSVRHVINAQILYPENAYSDEPILTYDGQKSNGIIGTYRKDIALPSQARDRMILDIIGGK